MSKQSEYSAQEKLQNQLESTSVSEPIKSGKKPFIEPEISPAVDVLEATTFLQFQESGATN